MTDHSELIARQGCFKTALRKEQAMTCEKCASLAGEIERLTMLRAQAVNMLNDEINQTLTLRAEIERLNGIVDGFMAAASRPPPDTPYPSKP